MSSSYRLRKRFEEPSYYLGSNVDHYVKGGSGECMPDYFGIPIGDTPGGVTVCMKKKRPDGSEITHPERRIPQSYPVRYKSRNLYDIGEPPGRVSNDRSFDCREHPEWLDYAIHNDLMKLPVHFDATGFSKKRKYGFDYIKTEPANQSSYYPYNRQNFYRDFKQ